ncbi:MAG: phosphatase PAP2 family protein [Lachnospiraceae bacterium]|jgi:membrane-associated phospholipid phosphatase|nr:phosphatase PAP2 family protein [Lachnospiraceae bacterium]
MEGILELEREILLFFQDMVRNPVLNPVLILITTLGNGAIIWVLLSLGLMIPDKTRRAGMTSLLALVVSLLINNVLLKNLVGRVRPYDLLEGLTPLIGRQWDPSFPSGHTGSSFAAAWVLYRELPKRFGVPALILAGLIGLSRLYVGVHYPTDVLFGVISGIGSGWIAMQIMTIVMRRRDR